MGNREWTYRGINCKVLFIRDSHHCGYIEIPPDNEFNQIVSGDDFPIRVHGGITAYGKLESSDLNQWLGFDCIHSGDARKGEENSKEHFWTEAETVKETEHMVDEFLSLTWEKVINKKLEYMPEWFKQRVKVV